MIFWPAALWLAAIWLAFLAGLGGSRLLVGGWCRARKREVEVMPCPEGCEEWVDLTGPNGWARHVLNAHSASPLAHAIRRELIRGVR